MSRILEWQAGVGAVLSELEVGKHETQCFVGYFTSDWLRAAKYSSVLWAVSVVHGGATLRR